MTVENIKQNTEIVKMLEDELLRAQNGEIQSIAIVTILKNSNSASSFSANNNPIGLIGEMAIVSRGIMDCCVDTRRHKAGDYY